MSKAKILLFEPVHEHGVRVLREFADANLAQNTREPAILGELGEVKGTVRRLA